MRKVLFISILFSFFNIHALNFDGVEFKDTLNKNGKKLVLNGVGKRVVAIFIKPHFSALYLESKSKNAEKIIQSNQAKNVIMHLRIDLSKSQLQGAITDGLKENNVDQVKYRSEIAQLMSMLEDSKKGQRLNIYMDNQRVEIVKGSRKEVILSSTFGNELLKLWIGIPPNKALKKGMLGL